MKMKNILFLEKITGFTTAEERIAGKRAVVPFLNQKVAEKHGAI